MKPITWIVLIAAIIIIGMILLTVLPQTNLLQTRVRQGIGTTTTTY